MEYSGAGGKLIHDKTRSKKSRDTVPLSWLFYVKKDVVWGMGNTYYMYSITQVCMSDLATLIVAKFNSESR